MSFIFELTEGPVCIDEDEDEYNPKGYWLGNTETNQIFFMREDIQQLKDLLETIK